MYMKKLILFLSVSILLLLALSSCKECIKCEIIGNSIDTISLIDNTKKEYDEFCGSSSETQAFRNDVQYSAEHHFCKIYSIRKIANSQVLATFVSCGGITEISSFEHGLDSLLINAYADQDATWVIDTIISNPATWKCDDLK